jgi:Fuc2NAc and GlcNAc transferase
LVVWILNLSSFIDGIACVEAVSVCLGGALFYELMGNQEGAIIPLVLAAVVGGFFCWNFPPTPTNTLPGAAAPTDH